MESSLDGGRHLFLLGGFLCSLALRQSGLLLLSNLARSIARCKLLFSRLLLAIDDFLCSRLITYLPCYISGHFDKNHNALQKGPYSELYWYSRVSACTGHNMQSGQEHLCG
jgi:hypothetical protein